jgi:hypothetical protein
MFTLGFVAQIKLDDTYKGERKPIINRSILSGFHHIPGCFPDEISPNWIQPSMETKLIFHYYTFILA